MKIIQLAANRKDGMAVFQPDSIKGQDNHGLAELDLIIIAARPAM